MKKILITTDGSEHAQKGLEQGRKIAEAFCSEVVILNVINDFKNTYFHESVYIFQQSKDIFEKQAKEIMQKAEESFKGFCGTLSPMIKYGDPAQVIIETIEEEKPDLVVMGSKGLTGIQKVVIGSVSSKVLNHTEVPILIVR
ncbi:universal stress protein [Thermotalea metallivorans]|uniref:Universal stress protein n=1 Tax=Thermotalea metallivorans TaxID=520762 RepID=A0A140L4E8_9FIRM|nr:universal stress protein [Thermotalea metallivorans]KXG75423.1 putative universal stress protein [Thermotalea metallivorans]